MHNEQILDTVDPEIVDRMVARKAEIDRGGYASPGVVAALALGSVPVALAVLSREVKAQSTDVTAVLNFALALEIFENEFYKAVLGMSAYAPYNAAFATVRGVAAGVPGVVGTLTQIQKHEAAHVATLVGAGASDVFGLQTTATNAKFDFTAGGVFTAATTDVGVLLAVAQGAEDTGVRAYKGQATNLMGNSAVLETALRIHSVEARHASRIRRIRRLNVSGVPTSVRLSGTVRGGGAGAAGANFTPSTAQVAAFDKIYAGEDNVTQGGINVQTGLSGANFGVDAATEAFDEPLDRPSVVAIVQPFIMVTIS